MIPGQEDLFTQFARPHSVFDPKQHMGKMEREFWVFHRENPYIYRLFERFALAVVNRGYEHFGARDIIHRIRWETNVETNDPEFKINNNHSPYYGRLWMRDHNMPGFFRTREIK